MEQELWQRCLQLISESVSQHVFDVWFRDITLDCYDTNKNTVVLEVSSVYVYEYIEELHVQLMNKVLSSVFKPGVKLGYRVRKIPVATPPVDFPAVGQIPQFSIHNARERLEKGLHYYLGDKTQWLPCYDQVVDWLSDNKGRGLLCIGAPGLGKTRICCDILPQILGKNNVIIVTAMEMGQRIDELLNARCVIIDNLGSEPSIHETVNYRRRTPFFELCDAAERRGILLIITTNLSTSRVRNPLYPSSIQERYGADVISRLRATVKVVEFKGEDFRIKFASPRNIKH